MKRTAFLTIALSMFLISCGSRNSEHLEGYEPSSASSSNRSAQPAAMDIPLNLKGLGATGAATTGAVNPEHGKPGHRCDIAVGAPLPSGTSASPAVPVSAPAQVVLDPNASSNVTVSSSSAAPATSITLNPEHGKPGHRCDIAVGAPLNSAPTVSSGTQSPSPSSKPRLNPEHGKPGHRCDIAVGAPLDGKPAPVQPVVPLPDAVSATADSSSRP